jgi:hypothetical protein
MIREFGDRNQASIYAEEVPLIKAAAVTPPV